MSRFLSLATATLCLGLLALAVFVFDPACSHHNLRPERNASEPTREEIEPNWKEVVARQEQINQLEKEFNRSREAKGQVAKEVIDGRRSLAEAIEEFRKLNEPWLSARDQERTLKVLRMSEVEWRGRNVIYFTRHVLADRPNEAAAVADRLEKELQKLLADQKKTRSAPSDLRTEKRNH
jgi:hypothetical protein